LESAYEACVSYELNALGLEIERQKPVPLIYPRVKLDCDFRADIVVAGQAVVEIRSKESLPQLDHIQLLFISGSLKYRLGLWSTFMSLS